MIATPVSEGRRDKSEALTLRVALSVIDTLEGGLRAFLEIDTSSSSQAINKPGEEEETSSHRPRSGRMQEIVALRAQVQELEQQLHQTRALARGDSSQAEMMEVQTQDFSWLRLADTQQRRRLDAEVRNAKLRGCLRYQQAIAKQMLKLSTRVKYLERALCVRQLPSLDNYLGPTPEPPIQLRSLDALILRASEIFSSKTFTNPGFASFARTQFVSTTPPEYGADLEAQSFIGCEARGCASFNGWIRIEPVRSPGPARTGPLSLIKWYRRTLLQPPAATKLTKRERRKWTQAVVAGTIRARFEREYMSCIHEVDDLLLTRAEAGIQVC